MFCVHSLPMSHQKNNEKERYGLNKDMVIRITDKMRQRMTQETSIRETRWRITTNGTQVYICFTRGQTEGRKKGG